MQKNKAAQALGKMTSPKKKISSKLNGLKGGYPKGRPNKKKHCDQCMSTPCKQE